MGILGFGPQFIPIPQPLPRCVDRVLNPLHVATFANEDMNGPIRLEHFIDLIFNLHIGDVFTAAKSPDFLHRNTFKVLLGVMGCASNRGRREFVPMSRHEPLGRSAAVTPGR